MPDRHSSAIVLGASMSGLLAAKALSRHFERITIVERDVLPAGAEVRKGVPESAHAHGLLASGYRVLDAYFPGMMDELEALGAPRGDLVGDVLWFQYGRWKLRHEAGLRGITVSRPCLEAAVRRRLKALDNVRFLEGTTAVAPTFDPAARRVTGLAARRDRNLANVRLHYDRMKLFPSGYLAIGDAVCSFNPIYGQGMSVAATEARVLDDSLAEGLDGLAPRFYGRTRKIIDIPWLIATGEDLRFPQVEGPRPPGSAMVNRYLERVHAVASEDKEVCRKFFDVFNLLAAPTSLMSPRVAWRVLARHAPTGPGSPWGMTRPGVPASSRTSART